MRLPEYRTLWQDLRLALTQHVPTHLLRALANATEQLVEVSGAGVTLTNATVWRIGGIWDPATHGRPNRELAQRAGAFDSSTVSRFDASCDIMVLYS